MPTMLARVFLVVLFSHGWILQAQEAKAPVPDAAAQKRVEKMIRGLFQKEFQSRDRGERTFLAEKLLELAGERGNDPATRFVMLRESQALAVETLSIETLLRCIDRMAERYEVNPVEMKSTALGAARRSARTSGDALALAKGYTHLTGEALKAGDHALATRAAKDAQRLAKTAKDEKLVAEAGALAKAIPELKREFGVASKADVAGKIDPRKRQTNLNVGRYLCFIRGDWERGLEFLLWCGEPGLATAARKEREKPEETSAAASLADAWWDLGETQKNHVHLMRYRSRARFWYEHALPGLTGLKRIRAERRLATGGGSSGPNELLIELTFEDFPGAWQLEGDYTGGNADGGYRGRRAARFVLSGDGRAWHQFREGTAANAETISVYARTTRKDKTARLHFMLDAERDLSVRFKIDSVWKKYTFKISEFSEFSPDDENPKGAEIATDKIRKVGIVLQPGEPRVEIQLDSLRIEGPRK